MTSTTTRFIGKSDALAMLEAAVAKRGEDFVYADYFGNNCLYLAAPERLWDLWSKGQIPNEPPTECACLIGVAINEAGVEEGHIEPISDALPELAGFGVSAQPKTASEFATIHLFGHGVQGELSAFLGWELTEAAARVRWAAQVQQDQGATWGEALAFAREVAALIEGD